MLFCKYLCSSGKGDAFLFLLSMAFGLLPPAAQNKLSLWFLNIFVPSVLLCPSRGFGCLNSLSSFTPQNFSVILTSSGLQPYSTCSLRMVYSEGCPVPPFHNLSAKFLHTVLKCYSQSDLIPCLSSPRESELSPSAEALSWSRSSFLESELWKLKNRPMLQWWLPLRSCLLNREQEDRET